MFFLLLKQILHLKWNKEGGVSKSWLLCNEAFVIIYLQAHPDYYAGNETSRNIQTDKEQSYLQKWVSNNLEWSGKFPVGGWVDVCVCVCVHAGTGSKPSPMVSGGCEAIWEACDSTELNVISIPLSASFFVLFVFPSFIYLYFYPSSLQFTVCVPMLRLCF